MNESDIITRIVEINTELDSLGVLKLEEERENLKKQLKELMMNKFKEVAVDEISGYYAEIQVRTKTVYDIAEFKKRFKDKAERYIKEEVDQDAVKRGVKNGDLSPTTLLLVSEKVPTTAALYIKKIEDNDS